MATETPFEKSLCGIHVDVESRVHLQWRDAKGTESTTVETCRPFLWATSIPEGLLKGVYTEERLKGNCPFDRLIRFEDPDAYFSLLKDRSSPVELEFIRLLENQFLLEKKLRMFDGLKVGEVRRMQVDIETACEVPGGFSNMKRKGDRILAIGVRMGDQVKILEIEAMTDAAERRLLEQFNEVLADWDPDIIEGHNLFNFDWYYLCGRSRRFRLEPRWGRFGQPVSLRNSRLRVAERWLDFVRMDIPGRTVFDTYLMIQVFDVSTRDLPSYRLKDVARYLGVTSWDGEERTYIDGSGIQDFFERDRETFRNYLADDLRETAGIADVLLPTYLAQVRNFPMVLQEACLRGTANKVDTLFLEKYFHAGHSLPAPPRAEGLRSFEGGYTRSFETGIFRKVLHYDVASLYPSLLLWMDRNPANDPLKVFIPLLREYREYRLQYKKLSRTAEDSELRREYQARQSSFKILINSFYGYLGFPGARFGDMELAAEVTAQGRELLKKLIEQFQKEGCTVLEADTDGIYLSSEKGWEDPEALLQQVKRVLPEGVELEYDGSYEAMFCYKAKNYALYDGRKVIIRGSALKSRGTEPYLKSLTYLLIEYLLGVTDESPLDRMQAYHREIEEGVMPVEQLGKSEYLSMSPDAYRKKIEKGGKPRRAALEVALNSKESLKMGDQVSYYVQPKAGGRSAAWQRARAVQDFDPVRAPYDPAYYRKKLDDWLKRYWDFLPEAEQFKVRQRELL